MTETPIYLDTHRGMAAQKATNIPRVLAEVEANANLLREKQGIVESQLLAVPAAAPLAFAMDDLERVCLVEDVAERDGLLPVGGIHPRQEGVDKRVVWGCGRCFARLAHKADPAVVCGPQWWPLRRLVGGVATGVASARMRPTPRRRTTSPAGRPIIQPSPRS